MRQIRKAGRLTVFEVLWLGRNGEVEVDWESLPCYVWGPDKTDHAQLTQASPSLHATERYSMTDRDRYGER